MARHELRLPPMDIEPPILAGVWLVRRRQRVCEGQPLLEIVTEAAVVDLSAPVEGRLVDRLVEEDDLLQTGQLLAVIESAE